MANDAPGRSLRLGETSTAELAELTGGMRWSTCFATELWSRPSDYDVIVVDGDLELAGDLRMFDRGLRGLVIRGALRVEALYCDEDDPAIGVFVLGDLIAARIDTVGALCVGGSLIGRDVVLGRHNDYSATVGRDLVTRVFVPEQHRWEIGGMLRAEIVLGDLDHAHAAHHSNELVRVTRDRYRDWVIPEALVDADGDEEIELAHEVIATRVRAGAPFLLQCRAS
jgi:hypothetical protein